MLTTLHCSRLTSPTAPEARPVLLNQVPVCSAWKLPGAAGYVKNLRLERYDGPGNPKGWHLQECFQKHVLQILAHPVATASRELHVVRFMPAAESNQLNIPLRTRFKTRDPQTSSAVLGHSTEATRDHCRALVAPFLAVFGCHCAIFLGASNAG